MNSLFSGKKALVGGVSALLIVLGNAGTNYANDVPIDFATLAVAVVTAIGVIVKSKAQ